MAKPSFPKWHIPVFPAPLAGRLRGEELHAMVVVWGAICEAIRRGEDPVFPTRALANLIAATTGRTERHAYQMLARLTEADLDGKRLLRVALAREESQEPALERGLPSRGTVIRPGEALEPWLRLVRSLNERSTLNGRSTLNDPFNFEQSFYPNDKEVPHGGGGTHDHGHEGKPPPPDTFKVERAFNFERAFEFEQAFNFERPFKVPALRAMAREIGIVSKAGFAAVEASGLGPRALWRLWVRVRDGGGGVGALVTNLVEAGEGARDLAPAPGWSPPPPVDPCPRCGEDLRRGLGRREACPACGARVRECSRCRELAPAEAPCPWCGAEPPPPVPEAGAGEDPPEASDPPADPDRLRLAWDAAMEALREAFPAAPDRLRLAAAEEGDDGWVLRVAVAGEPDEAVMGILHGSLPAFLAHRLGRPVRILPDGRI